MKKLLLIATVLFALAGCSTTPPPQPETITIFEPVYIHGADVTHPQRPPEVPLFDQEPEITVLNPVVVSEYYKAAIDASGDFTDEEKVQLKDLMDMFTALTVDKTYFEFIGLSKDEYFKMAEISKAKNLWIEVAVKNFEYYESLDLQLKPEIPEKPKAEE